MSMTDPIADMLTRIRNGLRAEHETVVIPASKIKIEIARILKQEGYINGYSIEGENAKDKMITVELKYGPDKEKVITGLKRISKPGLRVYAKGDNVPRVLNGLGIAIISTSKGLMTDRDARKQNLGGEVVAYVW
ncbi:MAG: 30S ribosomal protein S8 [Erysipelotrichaceae bacterium]|nr:30S ribosomal protein S8 [Erysipelotrichaceae bacterium]